MSITGWSGGTSRGGGCWRVVVIAFVPSLWPGGGPPHVGERQPHVGGHARLEYSFGIIDADFEPEHLVPTLVDRLHVSRRELGRRSDIRDLAFEPLAWIGVA